VTAEDDKRPGRPSTSKTTENFEKIQEFKKQRLLLNNP
jgi:chromosome segregation and condensation protein ScpB